MDNQNKSGSAGTRKRPASEQRGAGSGKKRPAATREAAGNRARSAEPSAKPRKKQTAPPAQRRDQKKKPARRRITPEVVYTPAKPFNRNRFLLRLLTAAAVVIAITFGISIFFKVETITVSGMQKYTAWDVKEASGIQEGDNLMTLNRAKADAAVKVNLPYVKSVRISIKLPDTVNIIIEESEVVYAIKADDGSTWLISSDGRVVEQTSASAASNYTNILGVQLSSPKSGGQAAASEGTPTVTGEENQPQTVTAAERLETALTILQYLEANSVIGEADSVDVTDMGDLELWYEQRYQVKLGDSTRLSYKISAMKAAIDQLDDYQSGELDVSFTFWHDEVGYTPFSGSGKD